MTIQQQAPFTRELTLGFLQRSASTGWENWLDHVASAGGCSTPIRLKGTIDTFHAHSGQRLATRSTDSMPDGVIYKACGTRRSALCPTCSKTYQHDAFHLIRAGLTGGKTVPDTVTSHPGIFVTLTAPSFGPIHSRTQSASGHTLPCRARRDAPTCEHGKTLACYRKHSKDDDTDIGQPLCPDCYDHDAQVIWNLSAGELWRRTRINADRELSRLAKTMGIDPKTVRLRYVKVAEFQRRGIVHFHALIRLDGHNPDDEAVIPPAEDITADDLGDIITKAVTNTSFITEEHPEHGTKWTIQWGTQLDVRTVALDAHELTDGHAAGYLAKYATKSTEDTGYLSGRLTTSTIAHYADADGSHIERLIDAAWRLGSFSGQWKRLQRWAHMLGFGGHFMTKARSWSTTFKALRATRAEWIHRQDTIDSNNNDTTLLVNYLRYDGTGWHTQADALMATSAAARTRQRNEIAREQEIYN